MKAIPVLDGSIVWFVTRYPKGSKLTRKDIESLVKSKIVLKTIHGIWGLPTTKNGKKAAFTLMRFGKKYGRSDIHWAYEFERIKEDAKLQERLGQQ